MCIVREKSEYSVFDSANKYLGSVHGYSDYGALDQIGKLYPTAAYFQEANLPYPRILRIKKQPK